MSRVRNAILAAVLLSAGGCTLTLDPDAVTPPPADGGGAPMRGECIDAAGGHRICGGELGTPATDGSSAQYRILGSQVGAAGPDVTSAQYRIVRGDVSP